jgi:hypothetical protein
MANEPINIATLKVGTKVVLADGDILQVIDNPQDGMWLVCRRLTRDGAAISDDGEETVFVHDVADVLTSG